jgi:hypothetical protein
MDDNRFTSRRCWFLLLLAVAPPFVDSAEAGLVGTDVTLVGSAVTPPLTWTETVRPSMVEFPNATPVVFPPWFTGPQFTSDVTDDTWRVQFTSTDSVYLFWNLLELHDVGTCPDGSSGVVTLGSWTTSPDLFAAFLSPNVVGNTVGIRADCDAGCDPWGTWFELEILVDCPLSLEVGGACPGTGQFWVEGVTPYSSVSVLRGSGPGTDPVPSGPCAGVPTSLSSPTVTGTVTDSDGDGSLRYTHPLTAPVCGDLIQVLDLTTCTLSNTDTPGP